MTIVENAVQSHVALWNAMDRESWIQLFSPHMVFEDPVGTPEKVGLDAVYKSWDRSSVIILFKTFDIHTRIDPLSHVKDECLSTHDISRARISSSDLRKLCKHNARFQMTHHSHRMPIRCCHNTRNTDCQERQISLNRPKLCVSSLVFASIHMNHSTLDGIFTHHQS